jgi:uncharacterized membrane protein YagU involved in acid resistance
MNQAVTTGLKGAATTALAGYVGTRVMEPVSQKLYELESEPAKKQEDEVRPGPPPEVAAQKTAGLLGVTLTDRQLEAGTMAFHYGLAMSWAPVYQVLRRNTPLGPVSSGLATGAAMSLVADEMMAPALGFTAPNRDYPLVTHLRGVVAHLVFGLAVAAVTEAGWAVLGR